MKKLLIFFFCAGIIGTASAQRGESTRTLLAVSVSSNIFNHKTQKEVSAKTIFDAIDKGQAVSYEGAIITGKLDLTELSNKKRIKKNNDYEEYKSTVEVPVSFKNCTFKDDFIAYKNLDKKRNGNWNFGDGETYTTDFEKNVVFENCSFEGLSEFKYSDFAEKASFSGTKFAKEANFKYADFKRESNFANCTFNEYANFKYSSFKYDVDFYSVAFKNYADFKYANFNERVTFKAASFNNHADFKYAEFKDTGNFDNAKFRSGVDMKYSNGKKYVN